jgi:hypothetical protein
MPALVCQEPYVYALARFLSPLGENGPMAAIHQAYCDESDDSTFHQAFVIAGFLGFPPYLGLLELKWEAALEEEHLEREGFHMADCVGGFKAFRNVPEAERIRLQDRFIAIINESEVPLFATGVMTNDYDALMPQFRAWRGEYAKPYYLAFQHLVHTMAKFLDDAEVPPKDTIGFMFDRQEEYEGRAKKMYDALWKDKVQFAHRLGPLCYVNRMQAVQVQAADVVAYLNLRYLIDVETGKQKASPQWEKLRSAGRMLTKFFSREGLEALLREHASSPPRAYI